MSACGRSTANLHHLHAHILTQAVRLNARLGRHNHCSDVRTYGKTRLDKSVPRCLAYSLPKKRLRDVFHMTHEKRFSGRTSARYLSEAGIAPIMKREPSL